jgi:nucleotide-binding universal stress UspA family protein
MMKNILLPTDFSKNSLNAIHYALDFFKNHNVSFFILNVQKVSDYTTSELMSAPTTSSLYRGVLDDNKKALEALIVKLQEKYPSKDYNFKALIDFDNFTDAINQAVNSRKIDLIIMGTNGATGAKETLFGSNTLTVMNQVKCPLIAVPEGYTFQKIKNILLSLNYQNISDNKITRLKEILTLHNAILKILDLKDDSQNITLKETSFLLEKLNKEFKCEFYSIHNVETPIAINVFEQLIPVEMHAMFIEKETILNRFIFGSETLKISYGSKVPLLIMHP